MKRVGLLTYHSVPNFGANLQALSTVSYLKNHGYDVILINWVPEDLEKYYDKSISQPQKHEHEVFVQEYLPISRLCRTSTDVSKVVREYEISTVLIGSDAVFSYKPILKRIHLSRHTLLAYSSVTADHDYPNPFWGEFKTTDDLQLISLSASAQFLDIDKCFRYEKKRLANSLKDFKYLSVRDTWTSSIVEKLIGKRADLTPDPVWAFNQNCSSYLTVPDAINKKYSLPEKYAILSFCKRIFPVEWYGSLYDELHRHDFSVVNLAMPEGCVNIKADIVIDVPISPLEWYSIIKNSSAYIGQRMHPMIVAFHNCVPFFIFDHYAFKNNNLSSSKIYDILNRAGQLNNYKQINDVVDPLEVVNAIVNFDVVKASAFIDDCLVAYNKMMKIITGMI